MARLDAGPAPATSTSPLLICKIIWIHRHRFAQPKTYGENDRKNKRHNDRAHHMEVLIGFKLSRPAYLAVWSPKKDNRDIPHVSTDIISRAIENTLSICIYYIICANMAKLIGRVQ